MTKFNVGEQVIVKYAPHNGWVNFHGEVLRVIDENIYSVKAADRPDGMLFVGWRLRKMHLQTVQDDVWVYGNSVIVTDYQEIQTDGR